MTEQSTDQDLCDLHSVDLQLTNHMRRVRRALVVNRKIDESLAVVETFCAIALMAMRRMPADEIRSIARTVEIKARLDGIEVVRGAA